jgi:crotonobetainyl-CoA:carnitine CoA-transferase CaiB-like acyl-CoA transferase
VATREKDEMPAGEGKLPLVVIEASESPAAAFAATLLGDFGAEVTVFEPRGGSRLRRLGGEHVQAVWWKILARNKRSIAIDPEHSSSAAVFEAALRRADIVLVDNGPTGRALQRLAREVNRKAQVTRVFATGEDLPSLWPDSTDSAFAGSATGVVALTGKPDEAPIQAEFPLADATSGILAAALALFELRRARLADEAPESIDLGLHEALQRMNEWQVVVAGIQGHAEPRNGNRFPMNWNVGNIFRTRDGKLLTVSAATPSVADRLMNMVGGEKLKNDPRFRTPAARRENMDALDDEIGAWIARHDAAEAMRLVLENDVVVGPIYDAADIMEDPHVRARTDIARMPDGAGGSLPMPAVLPKIDSMPGAIGRLGPKLGEDTAAILETIGFSARQIDELKASGAVVVR